MKEPNRREIPFLQPPFYKPTTCEIESLEREKDRERKRERERMFAITLSFFFTFVTIRGAPPQHHLASFSSFLLPFLRLYFVATLYLYIYAQRDKTKEKTHTYIHNNNNTERERERVRE